VPTALTPDVAWAVEEIRAKLPARTRAQRYYDGDHPLNFASEKFRNTFGELFQEFADNLCDDVVDEPTDRLQLEGWGGTKGAEAAAWWERERGTARSGSVHQHGHRSGDAFVIVWDDGQTDIPHMYVQDPRQMAVRYSALLPDTLEVAAKCWKAGKGYRLNLYYADRIEHYFSRGVDTTNNGAIPSAAAFIPYSEGTAGDDGAVEPIESHDKGRIPVFHFPNGELGGYGRSVLADVYPLQDALNKSVCDMLVTGESFALPHRWATGVEVRRDDAGREVSPFKDGNNLWWTKSEKAQFGAFPAADRKGFLDEQRGWRLEIARKGALPAHSVDIGASGNAPSGLSLLVAEGKLIKRCKDRQRDWGVVWRELVAFALSWTSGAVESKDLDPVWGPIPTRDEQALLETLMLKKALGVPTEQLLKEAGYSPEQVVAFDAAVEQEAADAADAQASAMGGRTSPPPGGATALPAAPVAPQGA
jgi:hypothetical protein